MAELHLHVINNQLVARLGEAESACSWDEIAPTPERIKTIRYEAVQYGRALFDYVFADEILRAAIAKLPDGERLLLICDDNSAGIPWEYLREPDGSLLAARLNMLRGLPNQPAKPAKTWSNELELLAVVSSPINEPNKLNVEQEWINLAAIAKKSNKAFGLKRVRPPEPNYLFRALGNASTAWVWFMGHSSVTEDGNAVLQFEDTLGNAHFMSAKQFASELDDSVQLVMLNSCQSSAAGEQTAFGNVARAVVSKGAPYALGMQFTIPDDTALKLSEALFEFLLRGRGVEEAVRRARRALESQNPELAGLPALYTSQRDPLPALMLGAGAAVITPDPATLAARYDMNALAKAAHFTGRETELPAIINALTSTKPADFVVLHGMGGTGKTALAREAADRMGWHFDDCGLGISFETFSRAERGEGETEARLMVNPQFAESFITQLARFYGLDPARFGDAVKLQEAIVQQRKHQRSLLALDNLETLLDALDKGDEIARALAAFIKKLREGQGAILITSRDVPPTDWGECRVIEVEGLEDRAGATLFFSLLKEARKREAMLKEAEPLSRRVKGHPLAVRLLAARFNETSESLPAFTAHVDEELAKAEQNTPDSLYDNARQRTLDACFAYSVKRLSQTEIETLRVATVFRAPFIAEFAAAALDDPENAGARLMRLVELSVLEGRWRSFEKGGLAQFELHPTLRAYAGRALPPPDEAAHQRAASAYLAFGWEISGDAEAMAKFNQDERLRAIVLDGQLDFDAALVHLPEKDKASLAYLLADPLIQFGYINHALELLSLSSTIFATLGDVREVAVTESKIADLHVSLGHPDEAMRLYEKSLAAIEKLGDVRSVAVTESKIADLHVRLGHPDEAMRLYEKSLAAIEKLGDVREVAVTRTMMSQALFSWKEEIDAIANLWLALKSILHIKLPEIEQIKHIMTVYRTQLGKDQFDAAWAQATPDPQPEWLAQASFELAQNESSTNSGGIRQEQLDGIVNNTAAVLTFAPDIYEEWRGALRTALVQAKEINAQNESAFIQAVLAIMDDKSVDLPADNPYRPALVALRRKLKEPAPPQPTDDAQNLMEAIQAFVNAGSVEEKRVVVEERQDVLFNPQVEQIFEQNIAQAKQAKEKQFLDALEFDLSLIRDCKARGIPAAFAALEHAMQEAQRQLSPAQQIALNTRAVLGPAAAHKAEWRKTLVEFRNQAFNAKDDHMIGFVELDANGNPSGLGGKLSGEYAAAWQTIINSTK